MVTFLWFTAFGGTTMKDILAGDTALITAVNDNISTALYVFFDKFPLAIVLKILGLVLICSFIITSADSGALVVDSLTSGGAKTPALQRVIWAVATGVVAAVLMYGGGLNALQTAVTISGLPFAILLVAMCFSLFSGLREDYQKDERKKLLTEKETYQKNILDLVNRERQERQQRSQTAPSAPADNNSQKNDE